MNENTTARRNGRRLSGGSIPLTTADLAVVVIVMVSAMLPGPANGGLKAHEDAAGSPLQLREMAPTNTWPLIVMLKAAGWPALTVAAPTVGTIWIGELTANGKFAVLLAEFVSPPPDTMAVSSALLGALPAILKVILINGKALLIGRLSARVQVRVLRVQFHPVPLMAVAVNPVERALTTVTRPLDGILPTLAVFTW
jgi:hypothetical protein